MSHDNNSAPGSDPGNPFHVIITRFNVKWSDSAISDGYTDKWMNYRIELFNKYTLPSIKKQTNKNFKWIVLLDKERSKNYDGFTSQLVYNGYIPIFSDNYSESVINTIKYINNINGIKYVATSRLDSDDVVHPAYIANLKAAFQSAGHQPLPYIIDFPFVAVASHNHQFGVKVFWHNVSQFFTIVESVGHNMHTALGFDHGRITDDFYIKRLDELRTLTVVHGGNIANGHSPILPQLITLTRRRPILALKLLAKRMMFNPHEFGF